MTTAAALVAIAISLLALGSSELRWRAQRKGLRAVGPAGDIRSAITQARRCFEDIVALGGRDASYFHGEHEGLGQHLLDLAPRPRDAMLAIRLARIAEAWADAFAYAPAKRGGRVVNLAAPGPSAADVERQRKRSFQCEVARDARELCQGALDRLNELDIA
jgi:hypothetical protein